VIVQQALAARIERAEGAFIAACSRAVGSRTGESVFQVPVAGGFATYAGTDSPFNKIAGTGFDGLPTDDQLAHVEKQYDTYGSPASFEISTLADPAIFELLTDRGYLLVGFEDVLVSHLTVTTEPVDGIEVIRADDQLDVWMDVRCRVGPARRHRRGASARQLPPQRTGDRRAGGHRRGRESVPRRDRR
jgi:hypothetical protein